VFITLPKGKNIGKFFTSNRGKKELHVTKDPRGKASLSI